MRKFLSLFAAILFAGSMMAEVGSLYYTFLPYKPAKDGVSDYTKTGTMTIDEMDWTVPGNWYATGGLRLGGKSLDGVDRTIIGQDAMGSAIAKIRIAHAGVTADKIVLNSVTVTTASDADFTQNVTTKTVTDFTVAKNAKDTIDIVPTTEPWAINSYYKIAFNLTNPQASNYAFVVEKILFYAYVAGGDPDPDPEPTTNTLYLKAGTVNYAADNATVAAWAWGTAQDGAWYIFAATETEGVSSIAIPTACENVKIMRWPASTTPSWDAESTAWNKTGDIALPATFPATTDMIELTAWDNATSGTWTKYEAGSTPEPPTPAAPDSIFFVNVPGWDSLRVHLWDGTAAGTTWPGVEMTKLGDDDKINGYDVYKYVAVEGAYTKCIFSNNGKNQTADLTWTSGKYFYDGAWYAKTEIPEPIPAAVPLQGNIWKVVEETPVRAGSHYIDEALLKVDGVYATTVKANARTIAGEEFTYAIQVRTDGYPSADNLAGKEKSGSTSLIITAKEDVDITLYYNRQVLNDTAIENDNKDLIVFDQAAIANKVTGTFAIDAYNSDSTYLNVTKKLALKKDHVYTVTASGTTLQLHGIKLEEHVPAMQIAGAWDVQEQAWVVNNMTLADNKLTAFYEVELAKGDYEFKVLKDGAWLTKSNDGTYGLHREWPGVAGVTDNAENNLKLTADAAGTYIFTWTFANDSIGITFPAPEPPAAKENLYIVPNQWAEGDAKIAAWTWSKDGSINAFTEFFAPKAEGNDTLVAEVLADADSIIFVRFNATATEPKWHGGEGYQWNQTPGDSIQWEKAVFTILPGGDYTTNGTWDVYTPAQPRLADGFYLIGQKGWAVDSLNADLLFTANPDNEGEYQLTVNLVANQSIKVVSVANDAIVAWYPDGQDNDYTIDEAHAGLKTIYFKPTGDEAWADFGGYFYIEPNQGTGVENGLSDQVQSTKVVRNGQLFIIRDGKTYTVQGVEVK